jgi:hypothetical protein
VPAFSLRPRLSIVPPLHHEEVVVRFCSWCGERTRPEVRAPRHHGAACPHCLQGTLYECDVSVAPAIDAPVIIGDAAARVVEASDRARSVLNVEGEVRGRLITELLVDADAASGADYLRLATTRIASGREDAYRMMVRPSAVYGLRIPLRLAVCGPPRSTLLVLETDWHP